MIDGGLPVTPELLCRASLPAAALVTRFPPRLSHRGKELLFRLSCPRGAVHRGTITVSRWRGLDLPAVLPASPREPEHVLRDDPFGYEPEPAGRMAFHLNFADAHLFGFYGGPLFAQDEVQVCEHPAAASVREWLAEKSEAESRFLPLTCEAGRPTPVLVCGVERRIAVGTTPDASRGRPLGLYGNLFARAEDRVIEDAVRLLDPPSTSHILAIEAPSGGSGRYTAHTIADALTTALSGFAAARAEAARSRVAAISIHTGYWGTGAYGGNRVLMALVQILAARLAGVDRLVFHAVGRPADYREALEVQRKLPSLAEPVSSAALVEAIQALGFEWGTSDGN